MYQFDKSLFVCFIQDIKYNKCDAHIVLWTFKSTQYRDLKNILEKIKLLDWTKAENARALATLGTVNYAITNEILIIPRDEAEPSVLLMNKTFYL